MKMIDGYFELICTNAMVYNLPETIYFKAAKKVHLAGLRLFKPEVVRQLLKDVPCVLTEMELGFEPVCETAGKESSNVEDEEMDVGDVTETARETFMMSER
ncbi:hypothetical protein QYM36_002290, partial [Artemia franciscana]